MRQGTPGEKWIGECTPQPGDEREQDIVNGHTEEGVLVKEVLRSHTEDHPVAGMMVHVGDATMEG